MFEFIAGVFTAYLFTWPALVILFVAGIVFESNSSRTSSVIALLLLAFCSMMYFAIPIQTMLWGVAAYIPIGLAWSAFRYRRWLGEQMVYIQGFIDRKMSKPDTINGMISECQPTNQLRRITAWVVVWPFSLIENFAGDLVKGIEQLVKSLFRGVYNRIFESAVAQIQLPNPPESK